MRPETRAKAEEVFGHCGLSLTEAFNIFVQQSINVDGLPFLVVGDNREMIRHEAEKRLFAELEKGEDSVRSPDDWISHEALAKELGVAP